MLTACELRVVKRYKIGIEPKWRKSFSLKCREREHEMNFKTESSLQLLSHPLFSQSYCCFIYWCWRTTTSDKSETRREFQMETLTCREWHQEARNKTLVCSGFKLSRMWTFTEFNGSVTLQSWRPIVTNVEDANQALTVLCVCKDTFFRSQSGTKWHATFFIASTQQDDKIG
jgi:hypothetical protein